MPLPATGQELLEALEPEEHKREFRVLTCLTFGTHQCFLFHLPPDMTSLEMTEEDCVQVALARDVCWLQSLDCPVPTTSGEGWKGP